VIEQTPEPEKIKKSKAENLITKPKRGGCKSFFEVKDSYVDYAVTIYVNDTPEILQNVIDFITEKQKEYFDFTLLSTHLIEKEVPALKPYNARSSPTFCQLLVGYDVPDNRIKLL